MAKKRIIIGIHGLRNKPAPPLLSKWWRQSIEEGFQVLDKPVPRFDWDMAYWAHILHPQPQDPEIGDSRHKYYLTEAYCPGKHFGPREPLPFFKMLKNEFRRYFLLNTVGRVSMGSSVLLSNMILKTMFKELDAYYHKTMPDQQGRETLVKTLIRQPLIDKLKQYQNHRVMLIAHSMGSIIAYDVLTKVLPDYPIHTFVTMGSPLGFPIIGKKIRYEQLEQANLRRLKTPASIRNAWINLSDMEDITALNYNLRYIFSKNQNGVRPFDCIVFSNYQCHNVLNPHKSFGYLRTADFTRIVSDFLSRH